MPEARCAPAKKYDYTPETDAVMREVYQSASMFLRALAVAPEALP